MDLLKGIKVIDLTAAIAGTLGTMVLGDLGADVIKIEPPRGEHYRHAVNGAILLAMNRNKRGVALDLKTRAGQEAVLKMVEDADVFVENFVPGTIEKLGLSYEKVKAVNPGIIYCSVSGFGQEGPLSHRSAYDPVAQAMAGIMIATGEPEGKPCRQVTSLIDMTASLYATIGILASLYERRETGQGKRIDVSMLDAAVFSMNYFLTRWSLTGQVPTRQGSGAEGWAPYQVFDTKDKPIWIGASTDKFWQSFCRALDLKELKDDPRFLTDKDRRKNRAVLIDLISDICRQYTSEELFEKMEKEAVPSGCLATVAEVPDNAQVKLRGLIDEFDYWGNKGVKTVKTPIMIGGRLPETKMQAPVIGEHTTKVLQEYGYSEDEIRELLETGAAVQFQS